MKTALITIAIFAIYFAVTLGACYLGAWLILKACTVFNIMETYTSTQLHWGAGLWFVLTNLLVRPSVKVSA